MIVWGGMMALTTLNTAADTIPNTDSWTATSTADAPLAECTHGSLDWQRDDRLGRI